LKHNILLYRFVVDVHKSFTISRKIRFQKRLKTHIHTSIANIEMCLQEKLLEKPRKLMLKKWVVGSI
jgi:hypothetical protein